MKKKIENSFINSNYTIPVLLIIVFTLILSLLLYIIQINSISSQTKSNELLANRYSKSIELKLKNNIYFLNLLAIEVVEESLPEQAFQDKVKKYLASHPEFINISWIDSNFSIKTVCPLEGNSHIIGLKIEMPMPKKASRTAKQTKKPIYTEPFEAIQGESSFETWFPVYKDNKFMGLFAAVYSSEKVISTWINTNKYPNTYFAFICANNELVVEIPQRNLNKRNIYKQQELKSLKNGLKLQVTSDINSPFTTSISIIITLLCLLILGITFTIYKLKGTQSLLRKKEKLLMEQNSELKVAKNKAEESDRLKSAFLANMSHEIRTPMNGILGFAGLLKNSKLSGEKQQHYIQIIEKGGERLLNIINDIISVSKIEANQMEVNIQECNINTELEYIYNFFKPEVDNKSMHFSYKKGLLTNEAFILTDKEKLYAILANLVKNSIKYSKQGTIEFGYNIKNDKESCKIEFYVKDTGIGIPVNRQKAIFERFIQADIADKMALQGAGLGLSISRAYTEMLGGDIWVESIEGQGSTFYFTLPCDLLINDNIKNNSKRELISEINIDDIKNLKVLIAEDDEASGVLLSIILREFCSDVLIAKTGKEAVIICEENTDLDLILMDIQMPELNGYDAIRKIRKFNKDIIIIAQSAYSLAGDDQKAFQAGCNEYITKPIIKANLMIYIEKYFKK